jgi:hypothetical protein
MSRTRRTVGALVLVAVVVALAALVFAARRRGVRPSAAYLVREAGRLARSGVDRAAATWSGLTGGGHVTDEDLERLFGEQPRG